MSNKLGASWGVLFKFLFFLVVIVLLFVYWFFPLNDIRFRVIDPGHSNFTLNASVESSMQFYENMRYSSDRISYKIEDCPLPRKQEMKNSLEWISDITILDFYEVNKDEEISISCKDTVIKGERGAFIAGEGGVTEVRLTKNFNVILKGKVILIRESQCPDPIIGTHELLHALGFDHSDNPNNIMYPTVNCNQVISEDLINRINYLYSFPSLPDLSFENVSAILKGRYLEINLTIRNNGLQNSDIGKIIIYGDGKSINELELSPIEVGSGRVISLTNLFTITRIKEIEVFIDYPQEELNKENNRILLEVYG